MPNIEFIAPWTERQQNGCPYTIKQFSEASQANRLLYLDSYKSSIVAFLDTFCSLCFAAGPESRSDEDGKLINIQANASNTKFSPCLITPCTANYWAYLPWIFMGLEAHLEACHVIGVFM